MDQLCLTQAHPTRCYQELSPVVSVPVVNYGLPANAWHPTSLGFHRTKTLIEGNGACDLIFYVER